VQSFFKDGMSRTGENNYEKKCGCCFSTRLSVFIIDKKLIGKSFFTIKQSNFLSSGIVNFKMNCLTRAPSCTRNQDAYIICTQYTITLRIEALSLFKIHDLLGTDARNYVTQSFVLRSQSQHSTCRKVANSIPLVVYIMYM
jgi:hypothetical protein